MTLNSEYLICCNLITASALDFYFVSCDEFYNYILDSPAAKIKPSTSQTSESSSLLNMVGNAIKQVQQELDQEKTRAYVVPAAPVVGPVYRPSPIVRTQVHVYTVVFIES